MSDVLTYSSLVERIEALSLTKGMIGSCGPKEHPLYVLTTTAKEESSDHVLLSAGVHGDEPAGVLGLLEFLSLDLQDFPDFHLTIFPCINPAGFDAGTRTNHDGVDLNRVFVDHCACTEVGAILSYLRSESRRYVLALDLHEDSPGVCCDVAPHAPFPNGYYCYESALHSSQRISTSLIRHLRSSGVVIASDESIYGDRNSEGAVLYGHGSTNSSYQGVRAFYAAVLEQFTNLTVVSETLTTWDVGERVRVQRETIRGALKTLRSLRLETSLGSGL